MSSVVYFIAGQPGLIKIGFTGHLPTRLAGLQRRYIWPLRILATLPGGASLEADLHRRFASDGAGGEWFNETADLLALIQDVLTGSFVPPTLPSLTIGEFAVPSRFVTEEECNEFARGLAIDLVDAEALNASRMSAYERVAKTVLVSPSWLRKLIGRAPGVVVQTHVALNLIEATRDLWHQRGIDAQSTVLEAGQRCAEASEALLSFMLGRP